MAPNRDSSDPAQIQRRIQHLRSTLLGGRGPGASTREIASHTRHRPTLGGRPAAEALEELAERTSIARRDPDPIPALARQRRAELADTIDALAARTGPDRLLGAGARRLPAAAAVTLLAVAVAVVVAVAAATAAVYRRPAQPPQCPR
jgi:hypothetical protein